MNINKEILDTITELKIEHYELSRYCGFGYCGFGSELLRQELLKKNISTNLLVCSDFKDIIENIKIKNSIINTILNIDNDEPNEDYVVLKKKYIKDKKLPKDIGHAVLLRNGTVCDITSDQFGLPNIYDYCTLINIWDKIYNADIFIKSPVIDFGIKDVILIEKFIIESRF